MTLNNLGSTGGIDNQGNIWVGAFYNNIGSNTMWLVKIGPTPSLIHFVKLPTTISWNSKGPIAFNSVNTAYVISTYPSYLVNRFNSSLVQLGQFAQNYMDVTIDASDNVYMGGGVVSKWNSSGNLKWTWKLPVAGVSATTVELEGNTTRSAIEIELAVMLGSSIYRLKQSVKLGTITK